MIKRRTFIKQTGLALAASATLPGMLYSCESSQALGLQLYSLRNTIGNDVRGTLKEIARIGFKEVETYGYSPDNQFWGFTVPEFYQLLKTNGLTSPSGHYGVDTYLSKEGTRNDFTKTLEVAKGLDQKYVVIPYISDPLRTSLDDYKRMADKLNEAGQMCAEAGLKLGYHNHAFEFDDFNGKNGYEVFLENTEKDLVYFEMDIYWVVRAGKDPAELIRKYPGRFPLWHVKDMSRSNNDKNTEIGNGTIDFAKIFDLAKEAGGKHFIVEQENFEMDPYKSLAQSFNYIKKDLL
ncbi:sugar phosphate isomerase/epimerase family protein [Christiangramia sabulilitoris]|uniref:Sugar phosphate isomerase/epimerase n=1 Tax=Christiangramia sabulilitoris TaxID=2583991 RepID=A0A550I838_9FLAO|nr:sugar phosphate isomerase/epimerase [Christiangramia sabulilitoris]TRO67140.1 sugar phosphate isomerase/epimerase [Christiangramia sabulilitoris]